MDRFLNYCYGNALNYFFPSITRPPPNSVLWSSNAHVCHPVCRPGVLLACLCFGENPQAVAWSAQPLCWSGWDYLLSHHSQGSSTERWSWNTLRVVTARVLYILRASLMPPNLFLIIQWRRPRYLRWSSTHDVVSREINLLLGSNLWPVAPSA